MILRSVIAAVTAAFLVSPAFAATQQECLSLWKTADVDANGALSQDEDKAGYIVAVGKAGRSLKNATVISRDEFLQLCADNVIGPVPNGNAAAVTTPAPGPSASRDIGKGDLTPSPHPLSEDAARKKILASGFRDIEGLAVDSTGIWRGTAVANGQRQPVAVDAQGDLVAKDAGKAPPAAAPPANSTTTTSSKTPPNKPSEQTVMAVDAGHGGPGSLTLWVFLLLGNAFGLAILSSMTSGGTSAMAGGWPPRVM